MVTDDYKDFYKIHFKRDFDFSKAYGKDANNLLLSELSTIIDYETQTDEQPHPMDLQGYDRKISVSFGFGIRTRDRNKIHFADFTVDFKEWNHNIKDPHYYYFYAYAQKPPANHKINFWMIFDYRKLKCLYSQGVIKPEYGQNVEHSAVGFFGFKIADLSKNNLIIAYDGEPEILAQLDLPKKQNMRIDRTEVAHS